MKNQSNQNTASQNPGEKLKWATPNVQEFFLRLIQQLEEEELMRLHLDEDAFGLLSSSTPSDYRLN